MNAGGWGTALAISLSRAGHDVTLWARRAEQAERLRAEHENATYLPGVRLPGQLAVTSELDLALVGVEIVACIPVSRAMRDLARSIAPLVPNDALVIHGTKGLEIETLERMSQVLTDELAPVHRGRVAVMSGPTHAEEVGRGVPTAVVIGCADRDVGARLQSAINSPSLRAYTNLDIVGVELCGSLKNVLALASGMSDGVGGGDNAKAALITRGLAEMGRLVVAAGGNLATVAGLAGMGDVIATCTSRHSRNRRAGEELGRGKSVDEVLHATAQVIEGVPATRAVLALAAQYGVELPIAAQVHAVLFEGRSIPAAFAALMAREPTDELQAVPHMRLVD